VDKSETITELAKALAKAQGQISPALKDSENPHFRSKYADLSSVWAACRKPLTDNGLSVVQMPVDAPTPGSVALTTLLLHTSGEYISSTVSAPLTKQDAQGIGSALTYLRRYALSAIIGVVADDDDDGNAASRPQATSYSAPRQQAEARPQAPQKPAQQATAPQSADRRDLMDRAMTLYNVMKEQGLKYRGKMFKDMDLAELNQAIVTMNGQLDTVEQPEELL
jgi:hypothetical protein